METILYAIVASVVYGLAGYLKNAEDEKNCYICVSYDNIKNISSDSHYLQNHCAFNPKHIPVHNDIFYCSGIADLQKA